MAINPYERCPELEGGRFSLRLVRAEDAEDLLAVYSDKKAVPYFNSDNCHGATFYCEKLEYVQEMIDSWLAEYRGRGFVRWTVIDKESKKAVGTVELFNRRADDYFTDCGILRLDVRSDYEREPLLFEIMQLIVPPSFELFGCCMVATKIPPFAEERRRAAERLGFSLSQEKLIGHDKTPYTDYFVLNGQ